MSARGRSGSGKAAAAHPRGTFGPPGNTNGKREHSRSASNTTSQKRTVKRPRAQPFLVLHPRVSLLLSYHAAPRNSR